MIGWTIVMTGIMLTGVVVVFKWTPRQAGPIAYKDYVETFSPALATGAGQGDTPAIRPQGCQTPKRPPSPRSACGTLTSGSERQEGAMTEKDSVSRAVVASATPLPQAAGATLHWDGSSGVCRDVGPHTFSAHVQQSSFQAKGPPAPGHRVRPYWTTGEICLVPALSPQAIEWEKVAALVTFDLDSVLLADTAHAVIPGATGELVWSTGRRG